MIDTTEEAMTEAPPRAADGPRLSLRPARPRTALRQSGSRSASRGPSAIPRSTRSTKSNGTSARPKSPTTRARSFSSRRTSRCPSPGRSWPPRWSCRSISTASRTRPSGRHSVRQLIHRVCRTIADWGVKDGYFTQGRRRGVLRRTDLAVPEPVRRLQLAGLVQRRAVSPIRRRQEVRPRQLVLQSARPARPSAPRRSTNIRSAAPASSSRSRTTWSPSCAWPTARRCSSSSAPGTGTDLSPIRSSKEKLSGGGRPSGPLSLPEGL